MDIRLVGTPYSVVWQRVTDVVYATANFVFSQLSDNWDFDHVTSLDGLRGMLGSTPPLCMRVLGLLVYK
jgi:hypothetical protein